MSLIKVCCTNCGANLDVDEAKDAAICPYCHTAYIVEDAKKKAEVENLPSLNNLLVRAETFAESGNINKAIEYYEKVLDLDAHNDGALKFIEIFKYGNISNGIIKNIINNQIVISLNYTKLCITISSNKLIRNVSSYKKGDSINVVFQGRIESGIVDFCELEYYEKRKAAETLNEVEKAKQREKEQAEVNEIIKKNREHDLANRVLQAVIKQVRDGKHQIIGYYSYDMDEGSMESTIYPADWVDEHIKQARNKYRRQYISSHFLTEFDNVEDDMDRDLILQYIDKLLKDEGLKINKIDIKHLRMVNVSTTDTFLVFFSKFKITQANAVYVDCYW